MKILVTGAGGFLGVRVVERLLAHGHTDIRCFLRDASKADRLRDVAKSYPNAQVELLSGNLNSKADAADALADVSLVFHLAAGLKGSCPDLFLNSVVASKTLIDALAARKDVPIQKTRVVLISSFGVYGVAELKRGARVNEETPTESHPELRDVYSYSKLRQEQLFREYEQKYGFELVVLRAGVIYGPGGGHFSNRVGLQIGPVFFHLGGRNLLPLSYVENCAEAIVIAGTAPGAAGQTFNVHDNDLPTAAAYLRQYRKSVKPIRSLRMPYFVAMILARMLESYHRRSRGQLPAILTRYKVASLWGGNRFSNEKLRSAGWRQLVSTPDAMSRTFEYFRQNPVKP
jgi:nucleoside-diphosphate-sugar epimerase